MEKDVDKTNQPDTSPTKNPPEARKQPTKHHDDSDNPSVRQFFLLELSFWGAGFLALYIIISAIISSITGKQQSALSFLFWLFFGD